MHVYATYIHVFVFLGVKPNGALWITSVNSISEQRVNNTNDVVVIISRTLTSGMS